MEKQEFINTYNYDAFTPAKVNRWMRFDESPPLGEKAPDFPLWNLEERATRLSTIWSRNTLTVVEFGSFT